MNMFLLLQLKLFEKRFCVMSIIGYFCIFLGGRLLGKPRVTCASPGKILGRMEKRIFSHDGGSTDRQNFPRARTSEKPCKGRLNKTYVTSELLAGSSQGKLSILVETTFKIQIKTYFQKWKERVHCLRKQTTCCCQRKIIQIS